MGFFYVIILLEGVELKRFLIMIVQCYIYFRFGLLFQLNEICVSDMEFFMSLCMVLFLVIGIEYFEDIVVRLILVIKII